MCNSWSTLRCIKTTLNNEIATNFFITLSFGLFYNVNYFYFVVHAMYAKLFPHFRKFETMNPTRFCMCECVYKKLNRQCFQSSSWFYCLPLYSINHFYSKTGKDYSELVSGFLEGTPIKCKTQVKLQNLKFSIFNILSPSSSRVNLVSSEYFIITLQHMKNLW